MSTIAATPTVLFDRSLGSKPAVSVVIGDWSRADSSCALESLQRQDVPRSRFEVIWVEYYDARQPCVEALFECARQRGVAPPVDRWIALGIPRTAICHSHLLVNAGILASRGSIVTFLDPSVIVGPRFVASVSDAFVGDPSIILHLDAVNTGAQSSARRFRTPEEVIHAAVNWTGAGTTGTADTVDAIHSRDYAACVSARRDDLLMLGGADEHADYLGDSSGLRELTYRLVNAGRREVWSDREFVYRSAPRLTDARFIGPHDGRGVSLLAIEARRSGRREALVRNPAMNLNASPADLNQMLAAVLNGRPHPAWVDDGERRALADGRRAFHERRHAEALRYWEPLHERHSGDSRFLAEIGWAQYSVGRYDDARATLGAALAIDPGNGEARRGLGWTLLAASALPGAVEQFTVALEVTDPLDHLGFQEALRGRGWALCHQRSLPEAIADFEAARLHARPDEADALQDIYRGLGWSCLHSGQRDSARHWFTTALEVLSERKGQAYDDANAGLRATETAAAVRAPAAVRREESIGGAALHQPATASRLRADLGWTLYQSRRYRAAIEVFDQALAVDPHNERARCGRGWAALHLRLLAEARRDFDAVVDSGRACGQTLQEAHRGRGWVFSRQGRFKHAVEDFSAALTLADAERDAAAIADARRGRGRAYGALGLKTLATADRALVGEGGLVLRAGLLRSRFTSLLRRDRQR